MTLLTLALALSLSQTDPVQDLGSSDVAVREKATRAFLEKGVDAVPELLEALAHPDVEVRSRANELLVKIGPARWIGRFLRQPRALEFFHHGHRAHLKQEGVNYIASILDQSPGFALDLDSRSETAALHGIVVFRAGALAKADSAQLGYDGAKVYWKTPGQRPVVIRMNEGAVVAAYEGELPSQPLCSLLWARVLEDPHDRQAACLLADVLDPGLVPVLRSYLAGDDAWAKASLALLSNYWAKTGTFDPNPDYFRHLKTALESARWGLAAPTAILAAKHPEPFVPILRAGFGSTNPWHQYLALGIARVTARRDLYDPAIEGFLASPLFDLQRESIFAALAVAPKEALPVKKIVDAAFGCNYASIYCDAFRSRKDVRLGRELAKNVAKDMSLVLNVMDVYADSDEVVDTFCASLPADIKEYYVHGVIDLLKRFAEGNNRVQPRGALAGFLRNMDATVADRALRHLVSVARGEALPEIRGLLQSPERELRRRGIEGLYAVWIIEKSKSDASVEAIRLMELAGGAGEKLQELRIRASTYARSMKGEIAPVPPDERKYELPRVTGCGGRTCDAGWEPVLKTPVERPSWKD